MILLKCQCVRLKWQNVSVLPALFQVILAEVANSFGGTMTKHDDENGDRKVLRSLSDLKPQDFDFEAPKKKKPPTKKPLSSAE
jgi:hypothetical protein